MADVKIQTMDRGPLIVRGDVELVDAEGNRFETKQQFALCRCGQSQNKPFCDGTHKGKFDDCVRAEKVL
ncbi:MAG: CDGSH iron-sulfur domain-containing protein [Firmicutes bacterium]|uniref:Iron-binding zinc finger CDGSH type n=1 Tax=Melghirimyces thermohalophilus TaxID=1236220 RepID=A0A1G6R5S0_9BACL|nr:CDGSH iron-sulfur domain-containing protein [Melghirimyces thermohalophilus]MDA8353374.1 CDGSH iron-sulfur domain-containing protein [Bacillota bacterium]SDC99634.1 Iron-binding zinc finger CDGSH type [Melghirimyces thermohalophilus]